MDVVGADGEGVEGVSEVVGGAADFSADGFAESFVEPDWLLIEDLVGGAVERLYDFSRGLNFLATFVDGSERAQVLFAELVGTAAAGVVGEPVTVTGPDEVRGEDDLARGVHECGIVPTRVK